MKEIRQRNLLRNIFLSRMAFVLFLSAIILLASSVYRIYEKSWQAELKNRIVEEELLETKERRQKLQARINLLEAEGGIESELRKKLQVKKPGEEYVVVLAPTPERIGVSTSPEASVGKSLFQKFIDFFNIF